MNHTRVVVYATCTLRAAENEDNVRWFEDHYGGRFEPCALSEAWGPRVDRAVFQGSAPTAKRHYISLWPHVHGTDGFFMARWKRRF